MGGLLLALLGVGALIVVRERVRRRVLATRGQLLAILAGTAVSYLGVIAAGLAFGTIIGLPTAMRYGVQEAVEGFDAKAKLEPGDLILATDGVALDRHHGPSLSERVARAAPAPIVLTIERAGARREVTVAPKLEGERWLLGVRFAAVYERDRTLGTALYRAVIFPLPALSTVVGADTPEVGGPMRIVEEFHVTFGFVEGLLLVLMQLATYALYVMFVVDLARFALAFRRR